LAVKTPSSVSQARIHKVSLSSHDLADSTTAPFVDGLEFQSTAGAPIEAADIHGTLFIAFDDGFVTGGTAMVTFVDGFHATSI